MFGIFPHGEAIGLRIVCVNRRGGVELDLKKSGNSIASLPNLVKFAMGSNGLNMQLSNKHRTFKGNK